MVDIELPVAVEFETPAGGTEAVKKAADLLSSAKFPVILNGAGVVLAGGIEASAKLAEALDAPVCVGYQHNDAFPGNAPAVRWPTWAITARKQGMELIKQKADVVLALGTRLNPFSTLPGYGIDYWPADAKIIQVDINPDRIGLTKKVTVGIIGDDAKQSGRRHPWRNWRHWCRRRRPCRSQEPNIAQNQIGMGAGTVISMTHEEQDDPGTTWNQRARAAKPDG